MATLGEEIINSSTTIDYESNSEVTCSPCQSDGKKLEAVGYCETCEASLCELCFKCHTVPKPMRKHRLLKRAPSLVEHEQIRDISQCPKHEGEMVLFHCPTHSFLGCHTCFFRHQKKCRKVKYIPDISETITSSNDFTEFMTKLNKTAETSKTLVEEFKHNIQLVEDNHSDAISAIQAFKLEILEEIYQREKELYEKADMIKQKSLSRWNSVVDKHLQAQTKLKTMATEMEVLQNKNRKNDLYITMLKSKVKLQSIEAELYAAKGKHVVKPFNFEATAELREALKNTFVFGKLCVTTGINKVEHAQDINVGLSNDDKSCIITGSTVISEQKVMIADYDNEKVKIIDTKQQKISSSLTLSSPPWGLAKLTDSKVAATLPNRKAIVLIRTDPVLSVDTEIVVNGICYGVAYGEVGMVVGFIDPHKVEIIDLKGSVLRSIETDEYGHALFYTPYYIAINSVSNLIYVSNYSRDDVMCLRFDGTLEAVYKDDDLERPMQVIEDGTGNVYVLGHISCNVHQITEDCKKNKVIMTSEDGLSSPTTISYEETEGKFYVGNDNVDSVNVYQVISDSL